MAKVISKQELQEIYEKHSTKEACQLLQISVNTFYKLLKEAGIPRSKKKIWKRKYLIV